MLTKTVFNCGSLGVLPPPNQKTLKTTHNSVTPTPLTKITDLAILCVVSKSRLFFHKITSILYIEIKDS